MVSLTRCELDLLEDIYLVGTGYLVNVEVEDGERDQECEYVLKGNMALINLIRDGQQYFTKIHIQNNEAVKVETWGKTIHGRFFKRKIDLSNWDLHRGSYDIS